MKVAALAALGVLVAFSAGAAQQQRQLVSPATTCDKRPNHHRRPEIGQKQWWAEAEKYRNASGN